MKRILLAAVVCVMVLCGSAWGDVAVDEANFPDDVFRQYVSDNFDKDNNGTLSDSEIASVKQINVERKGISSLKGIEHFTGLTHLYCYGNQLDALDVSNNTALRYLLCYSNKLTALDLSKNTELGSLYCNDNQIAALDVSKNELSELRCDFDIENTGSGFRLNFDDFKSAYNPSWSIYESGGKSVVVYSDGSGAGGEVITDSGSQILSFPNTDAKTLDHLEFNCVQRTVTSVYVYEPGKADNSPTITTTSLSNATAGASYSQTLAATGTSPITWAVSAGSLPAGLTLSTSGTISGTPTASGTSTFTVKATNTAGDDTKQLSITVNSAPSSSVTLYVTGTGTIPNPGSSKIFPAPSGRNYTFQTVKEALNFAQNPRSYIGDNYPGWSESAGYGYADVLTSAISTVEIVLDITEVGSTERIWGYWDEVKNVTITASNPSRAVKSPNSLSTHFNISGKCQNLTFMDITFSGSKGGGVDIHGAKNVMFSGVTFKNCKGDDYGVVYFDSPEGKLEISGCTFEDCIGSCGGAIYTNGTITVDSSLFSGNVGGLDGGGAIEVNTNNEIHETDIEVSIHNSYFYNNHNDNVKLASCGAIGIGGSPINSVNITSCTFSKNHLDLSGSAGTGGAVGVYLDSSSANLLVANCTFYENSINGGNENSGGGALVVDNAGNTEIVCCTFTGNSSTYRGGALYVRNGGGKVSLAGNIAVGNTGTGSFDIYSEASGNIISGGYNRIGVYGADGGVVNFYDETHNETDRTAYPAKGWTKSTFFGNNEPAVNAYDEERPPYIGSENAGRKRLPTLMLKEAASLPLEDRASGAIPYSTQYNHWTFPDLDARGAYRFDPEGASSDIGAVSGGTSEPVKPEKPAITTTTLPNATTSMPYTQTLTASGTSPITWTLKSGKLPDGITLNSDGTISGTPSLAGSYTFTVKASNSAGDDSKRLTLRVTNPPDWTAPAITTTTLNPAAVGKPYTARLEATGSPAPTWRIASGKLPAGLKAATAGQSYSDTVSASGTTPLTWSVDGLPEGLTFSNGTIRGKATTKGTYPVTVTVSNSAGTDTKTLTLDVHAVMPVFGTTSLPAGTWNKSYRQQSP